MARRRKNRYVFAVDRSPHRVRRFLGTTAVILLAVLALAALASFGISREAHLETEWVTVAQLPSELEQFSILHLSDLHGAWLGSGQSGLRRLLEGQRVSVCVMTGDMLGPDGETEALEALVALLPPETLKVYLPGDEDPPYLATEAHGGLTAKADWAARLEQLGVTMLDEPLLIERGTRKTKARLWLIPEELYTLDLDGLERTWQTQLNNLQGRALTADEAALQRTARYQVERAGRIRERIREIQSGDVQIVVTHVPLTEEYVRTLLGWTSRGDTFSIRQASLALAGHFCAGPFRLPGIGAVWVPDYGWFPPDELVQGMSWPGGLQQYISPGLGSNSLCAWQPFRLFNHPVVTKIYLTSRTTH